MIAAARKFLNDHERRSASPSMLGDELGDFGDGNLSEGSELARQRPPHPLPRSSSVTSAHVDYEVKVARLEGELALAKAALETQRLTADAVEAERQRCVVLSDKLLGSQTQCNTMVVEHSAEVKKLKDALSQAEEEAAALKAEREELIRTSFHEGDQAARESLQAAFNQQYGAAKQMFDTAAKELRDDAARWRCISTLQQRTLVSLEERSENLIATLCTG